MHSKKTNKMQRNFKVILDFFQVQLLTGIGRFGEMTYIFDSIKQNERFELLLKKGIDRVGFLF